MEAFGRCETEYRLAYEELIAPTDYPSALAIGTGFHAGVELLHRGRSLEQAQLVAEERVEGLASRARSHLDADALSALAEKVPMDLARVRAMLAAWFERWLIPNHGDAVRVDRDLEVLETEMVLEAPLVNPSSGRASRTFLLSGRLDAIVRHRDDALRVRPGDGREGFYIHEIKTTGEDLDSFAEAMRFSAQPQLYGALAENHFGDDLGPLLGTILDVVGKPRIRPKKSESAVDFETRALEEYRADPERFFRRVVIPANPDARREALMAAWRVAQGIRTAERFGYLAKRGPACRGAYGPCKFQRWCWYDDHSGYAQKETAHEELVG
jgi:hypothetical protein